LSGRRKTILICAAVDLGVANAASIHLIELVRGFLQRGYEAVLIAPRPPGASLLGELAGLAGLELRLVPSLRRMSFCGRSLPNGAHFILECLPALRECRRLRPSFAYVRAGLLSWLLVWVIEILGRTPTMSEHNGWYADEAKSLGHGRFGAWAMVWAQMLDARAARRVRTVTPGIGSHLRERGIAARKLVTIGNATNLAHFTPGDRAPGIARFGLDPSKRYIGFIGNLAPWQGVDIAIAAFHRLRERQSGWRLLIAGDGPDRPRLEAATRRLGLEGAILFIGRVDYADASLCINVFDIAVAPFTGERNMSIGLSPLKIRDYAACGCPVVAADIPGLREFATSGWLLSHKPDDPADLARVLDGLAANEARRQAMGSAARAYAERHFGWGTVVEAICAAMASDATAAPARS
jgi:glycosyltransferase involved in cell wall biosynthesis